MRSRRTEAPCGCGFTHRYTLGHSPPPQPAKLGWVGSWAHAQALADIVLAGRVSPLPVLPSHTILSHLLGQASLGQGRC